MNNTTTAINESVNASANSSFWKPDFVMPDVGNMNTVFEAKFFEILTSWGMDVQHTLFIGVEVLTLLRIMYYLFVFSTSKSSNVFKPVFYIVALVLILLMLGVI